jgi:hypothetical protein
MVNRYGYKMNAARGEGRLQRWQELRHGGDLVAARPLFGKLEMYGAGTLLGIP